MAEKLLEIKKYPDPVLRKVCQPVEEMTARERELLENMTFTMHTFSGIGLAGPQIGIPRQLIIAHVGEDLIRLANPKVLEVKGTDKMIEGCLSIPDVGIGVERAFEVVVTGLNERGEQIEVKAKGLLARVLQHEIDHLKGKLIIDYAGLGNI